MSDHKWLIRNTASKKGRNISVTPENSDFQYISAGRIVLDNKVSNLTAVNEGAETTLLVLNGRGNVKVGDQSYNVGKFDGIYVP